jgi:hypothetical protein
MYATILFALRILILQPMGVLGCDRNHIRSIIHSVPWLEPIIDEPLFAHSGVLAHLQFIVTCFTDKRTLTRHEAGCNL